jgi:hypothetical protein
MLYFMLKKEIMKFVKNIFVEKKSISDGLEFEGTKINNLINGKGRTIILKLIPMQVLTQVLMLKRILVKYLQAIVEDSPNIENNGDPAKGMKLFTF